MTTTLLPQPTMRAPHLDERPCVTHPAQWWDTGNDGNAEALALCAGCPMRDACTPDGVEYGVIRAGVAYDDRGRALAPCDQCGHPMSQYYERTEPICTRPTCYTSVAEHHDDIVAMCEAGRTWTQIGQALGISPDSARRYWRRHIASGGTTRRPALDRLPEVVAGRRYSPTEQAGLVDRMLTDPVTPYSCEEVAWVIGSTTEAVKSYWYRYTQRQRRAGLPTVSRRHVCNRAKTVRALRDVA